MTKILPGILISAICVISCKKNDSEGALSVKTDDVEIYTEGIYNLKGTVTVTGDLIITDHGFCWSGSSSPEITGKTASLGTTSLEGGFSVLISDVEPGKTYHVKAFASDGSITYYGEEKSFTTPADMIPAVKDVDGNIYSTVKIGDQIWMKNNLKVTHYPDGSPIQHIPDRNGWFYMPWYNPAYCWYENYGAIAVTYGNLYSWPAAVHISSREEIKEGQVQGVCPDGWHLPSDEEWKKLEIYLGMSPEEADGVKWRGDNEGGKLKFLNMWQAPNTGATNETSFSAIPSGYRDGAGDYYNIEKSARFWTSSTKGDYTWMRQLDYNTSKIFRDKMGVYDGESIRCVKNVPEK